MSGREGETRSNYSGFDQAVLLDYHEPGWNHHVMQGEMLEEPLWEAMEV